VREPIPGESRSGGAPGILRRSSLLLGLAFIVVGAGLWGNASAAVTGLQRVHAESVSNSFDKAVSVSCPAGKQVTGAGAEIINGAGQVILTDVVPNGGLTSVTAEALEDQSGYANNWILRAYAICATPPPGLERVLAESPFTSLNKSVTATCPAGKRLLGAGGEIFAGGNQVVLEDVRVSSLTGVTAQGVEDQDGTAGNWFARAYAICANPVHLLERVAATSPTDSSRDKSATATCSPGKRVVGAGSEIGGGGGQVVMDDLRPNAALDSVTVTGFEDGDGTTGNWFVRAIAICAAASQRVVAVSPNDSSGFKELFPDCPSDMRQTGGGADITGGGGHVRLIETWPASATAVEVEPVETNWFLRSHLICATPLPGRVEIRSDSIIEDSSDKTVTATCPAGTRTFGAGAQTFGFGDGDDGGQGWLVATVPNPSLTRVTLTALEDESGSTGTWELDALGYCANPPPGLELISATSPTSSSNKSVTATCPSGKNLLGTGAEIVGGLGQVVLDDLTPNDALSSVIVTGLEDGTGFAGEWFLRSYAICANP
jgi:hypothetical protein